ncbi:MAG: tetratricopeptide repeat protein [Betaproteobacteria bacterium]|nr:tetratricopeptide repeat protein [Betaproteobacteria bacterium]
MQRFRWIALQGSSRGFLPRLLLFVLLITTSGIPAFAADVSVACSSPVARVVSIQGSIELLRARQNDWSRVTRLDTPLCEGDRLRTGALSRAALFIQAETLVRVDQNTSISVSQTAEETRVEFTQEDIVAASTTAHTCGAGYFITRFPRKFRVNTPHLNAAVEGTEFLVAMRCESTELSVFEGKVLAASAGVNVFPSQSVVSGQTLTIGGSEPPAIRLLIKPADAVQWTLYYPPITPAGAVPVEDCRAVAQDNRVSCLIARAEQLLRAGRVEEAQANIGDALATTPYSSDAKALSSIISLVKNDKAEALRLAKEAVEATTNSSPAWLALSYAQQADFKLEAALTSAQRAAELTPSALALARVAELQLSLGWTREAEKTATQAVAANPSESRAHMILGFVHLAQIKVKEAREDFGKAIESNSTDPLSRLGLGLAIIREGKLVEGREQIEIAVALDPTNSLIRSYVGKAYYEENTRERDQLASIQFGLAKGLDPKDPTPWFYDAMLQASENRPVEALDDLQRSVALNDGRAIYRSKFALDQDRASRTANIARTYQELGFDQLALSQATSSIAEDPVSYSAHRFLADTYSNFPRYTIASESELLQAQLRQPLSFLPPPPLRAQGSLSSTSPKPTFAINFQSGGVGFNEYDSLLDSQGSRFIIDGLVGSRRTVEDQLVVGTVQESAALTFGQAHFNSLGLQDNTNISENVYTGFAHFQTSPNTSFQTEFRSSDSSRGAILFPFDPILAFPINIDETVSSIRIGIHHSVSPSSEFLVSAIGEKRDTSLLLLPISATSRIGSSSGTTELQYSASIGSGHVVSGIGAVDGRINFQDAGIVTESEFRNAYTYGFWQFAPVRLHIQAGLSYERMSEGPLKRELTNPKIGLIWRPSSETTFRVAQWKTLKRQLVSNRTIEPTQVAGFNQFFDDTDGSITRGSGLGVEQKLASGLYVGAEATRRRLTVPLFLGDTAEDFEWRESTRRIYLYSIHSFSNDRVLCRACTISFSAEMQQERFTRPVEFTGDQEIVDLETRYFPLAVTLIPDATFSARVELIRVSQDGHLQASPFFNSIAVDNTSWLTNLRFVYRLPRRLGVVRFGADNLFDHRIKFVEIDPSAPRVAVARFAFASLILQF